MKLHQIIQQPVMTEKALKDQKNNCYTFWVKPEANKNQIRQAVEKMFAVQPETVRTNRIRNKKKAYVQLSEGEEISLAKFND